MASKCTLGCIFLASGRGRRFGGNKLIAAYDGKPLIDAVFARFPGELFLQNIVVTRYAQVAVSAALCGYTVVEHNGGDALAETIGLGLSALRPGLGGCLFAVCDQPRLSAASVTQLVEMFLSDPSRIVALGHAGQRGNPVIFPAALFGELAALTPAESGGAVIARHAQLLTIVEVTDPRELTDIDYPHEITMP